MTVSTHFTKAAILEVTVDVIVEVLKESGVVFDSVEVSISVRTWIFMGCKSSPKKRPLLPSLWGLFIPASIFR